MHERGPGGHRRTGGAALALAAAGGAMILALGGCGQSGPLYLPPEKSSLSAAASAPGLAPGPASAHLPAAVRPGALRPVPGRAAHG